jgi:hypothetical protein
LILIFAIAYIIELFTYICGNDFEFNSKSFFRLFIKVFFKLFNMKPGFFIFCFVIALNSHSQDRLFISSKNDNSIKRYDIDTKMLYNIISMESITDSEFDENNQCLFWLDKANNKIVKYDLNANQKIILLTNLIDPQGIYLDKTGEKVYFSEGNGKIGSIDYNGTFRKSFLSNLEGISQFAIDFSENIVIYSNKNQNALLKTDFSGENLLVLNDKAYGVTQILTDDKNKKLYWSQKNSSSSISGLKSVSYSGGPATNVIDGLFGYFSIDFTNNKIYATLIYGDIYSYNINGTDKKLVLEGNLSYLNYNSKDSSILVFDYKAEELLYEYSIADNKNNILLYRECRQPAGLRLDTLTKKIFFINRSEGLDNVYEGSIVRSEINGKELKHLIINDQAWIRDPINLEIYSPDNKIYWLDKKLKSIYYADLDGKNQKKIYNTAFFWPSAIKIDKTNLNIYWSDYYKGINRCNLLGIDVVLIYKPATSEHIKSIEVIGNHLYWIESIKYSLKRSDLDGKNVEELLDESSFISEPSGIAKLDSNTLLIALPGVDKIIKYDIQADTTEDYIIFENGFSPMEIQVVSSHDFPTDNDGDGFFITSDCDDNDYNINPGAEDILFNEIDENCDGTYDPYTDFDNDSYLSNVDCDDNNPMVNPGETEIPYDGLDNDCDTLTLDDDLDQDGFNIDTDCNDNDPNIYPGAPEILDNGIDEDCDGKDQKTATFELNNTKISVFPNPVSDIINIETELEFRAALYSMDGYLLIQKYRPEVISIHNFFPGIYLLEIRNSKTDQRILMKILVER